MITSETRKTDPASAIGATVILILFAIGFVVILVGVTASRTSDIPFVTFVLTTVAQAVGALVAVLASLVLLIRAVAGASLSQLAPLILPALAGLSLATSHWAGPLAIGLLAAALVVKEILSQRPVQLGQPEPRRPFGNRPSRRPDRPERSGGPGR